MAAKKISKPLWIGLIVFLSGLTGVYIASNQAFRGINERAVDLLFQFRPSQAVDEVAIVMVDEKALEDHYGYYDPLPRAYMARLVDTLAAKGARLIGIDIAYFKTLPMLDPVGDTLLVEAFRRAGNVFAVNICYTDEEGRLYVQQPDSFFLNGMKGVGFADLRIAGSGGRASAREVWPSQTMDDGSRILSFSGMAYCLYHNITPDEFVRKFSSVPLTDVGTMMINFAGPPAQWKRQNDGYWLQTEEGVIPTYRSSRLTGEGSFPEELFKNKLVFIGNGSEFVPDRFITPYYKPSQDNWMYGAEVHANAFLTLHHEKFIREAEGWWVFAIGLILGAIMTAATIRLGFGGEISVAILLVLIVWAGSYMAFAGAGIIFPATSLTFSVAFAYFATSIYQAFTEERTKKQIRSMFARYAPPAYVDELIKDPDKLNLGGEDREITVLFSDIEGFTTISEKLSPHELVNLLNEYLGAMTKVIFNEGGTLDKYIGDAIVAVFGAPLPQNEHALHACYAALEMQKTLNGFRDEWIRRGLPSVRSRVGINTGHVVFGNIGSEIRYDYTAIGDQMNLGSRLEGANKEYGTYIMISEFTYERVRERVIVRDLDSIIVKGKSMPVKVYELIGRANEPLPDAQRKMIECYQDGIKKYRQRQFGDALQKFEQALTYVHTDEASKLYVRRCKELIENPPPENWDGTYSMTSK